MQVTLRDRHRLATLFAESLEPGERSSLFEAVWGGRDHFRHRAYCHTKPRTHPLDGGQGSLVVAE